MLCSYATAHDPQCVMAMCAIFSLLSSATGLIRTRWLDCIAGVPPVLIILAFKIYISKTAGARFRYYEPTAQEAEAERMHNMSEKRTHHSDMEKRFLHPALQADKLFTVMVHKFQEALAREVLSAYPWFAGKHDGQGVEIKAVGEVSRLLASETTADDPSRRTLSMIRGAMDQEMRRVRQSGMRDQSLRPICLGRRARLIRHCLTHHRRTRRTGATC